ncbi:MAG: hypothetical protein WDW36_008680 [Sanguina aurantia]
MFKLCGKQETEGLKLRVVNISGDVDKLYLANVTSTTKYNLFTFLPKALFEQYRRVANIYFTLVAGLSLSPYTPVRAWTTWTPLAIVLGVSLFKEGYEDYKRYAADKEINSRKVEVLNPATKKYEIRAWSQLVCGDVVVVRKDEFIPADLIFLTAENEEGTCYIETMNLDGETNLKIKKALDATMVLTHESLAGFRGVIKCEAPNEVIYQFTGNMELQPPFVAAPSVLPLSPAAMLLRGCSLRNTTAIHGVVVYAGHDTKVFMNATRPPSKRSNVERTVDYIILFMFALLFSMCLIGAFYSAIWTHNRLPFLWYMRPDSVTPQYDPALPGVVGVTDFITNFILYGYLIPISLYISIEIVKVTQAMVFIASDLEMYHEESDTPALARTSNLNEELGMVSTIMTDKTGTLTRNVMEFFKCSVAGVSYGAGVTEIERANCARKGQVLVEQNDPSAPGYREQYFNFFDTRLMGTAWCGEQDPETLEMFFRMMAVCHTVIPDGPPEEHSIKYECESPDEAALVVAAKVFGFFFYKRTNTSVFVRERTRSGVKDVEYQVLNVLEFNSTRKRQSVIIRDPQGRVLVFCKGADTAIYERLDRSHPLNTSYKAVTTSHMEDYGSGGLRTLCLAYTEVEPAFYASWQKQYIEAKTSLEDRDAKLDAVAELIERDLRLLGCTAIEDKLQEGVPLAIEQLAQAGIRIWVLTGDKQETAINIAYACSLITERMTQFIITGGWPEVEAMELAGEVVQAAKLASKKVEDSMQRVMAEMDGSPPGAQFAIIIDGKALSYALHPTLRDKLLRVGWRCETVVCCRVSPLQKSLVTALVASKGEITLAIGDGANDVGMILKAHIGVGISGQEGMQAVMSADFAIAQFRFLVPLLLVHGRWSYKRITRMVNFFFYKNLIFGISIFAYNAFCAFSGQYIYEDTYMTLYNVIFTSVLPLIIGMFDRDMDRPWALKYPGIYKQGQRNEYFNRNAIVGWICVALYQVAIIVLFVLYGSRATVIYSERGDCVTMFQTGVIMYTIILIVVHCQMLSIMEQFTFLHHIAVWGSQAIWIVFLLAFGALPVSISADLYNLFIGVVGGSPQYWLYLLVTPAAAILPVVFFRMCRRQLFPADHEIVQEIQKAHQRELRQARGGASLTDLNQAAQKASALQGTPKGALGGYSPPYPPQQSVHTTASPVIRVDPRSTVTGGMGASAGRASGALTNPSAPFQKGESRQGGRSVAADSLHEGSLTSVTAVPPLGARHQAGGLRQPPSVAFDAHGQQAQSPSSTAVYASASITNNPMRSTQEPRLVVELPSMKRHTRSNSGGSSPPHSPTPPRPTHGPPSWLSRPSSTPAILPSLSPAPPAPPEHHLPPSALHPLPSFPGQILSLGPGSSALNPYANGVRDHLPVHGAGPAPPVSPLDGEMLRVYGAAL